MAEENEDATGGDSSPQDEKTVPEGRFKQVYKEKEELKRENESLKNPVDNKKQSDAESNAEEYLEKLVGKELTKREEKVLQDKIVSEKKFDDDVDNLLDVFTDVKRKDFLEFMEENKDEFSSTKSAMSMYRKMNDLAKETEEKTKENQDKKPSLPKNEGTPAETPIDDSNKTYEQIVQEEIAKAMKE